MPTQLPPAVADIRQQLRAVLSGELPFVELLTSGSTGAALPVRLSGSALGWSAAATHRWLGGPGRWVLALSPHRVAGLQVVTRSLLAQDAGVVTPLLSSIGTGVPGSDGVTGADGVPGRDAVPGPDAVATLANTLQAAQFDASPVYVSLVPTQLYQLLAAGRADALAACAAVLVGGAAIPPALVADAEAAGVRLVRTYGMTETAGGCVYNGMPLPGVGVRLMPVPGAVASQQRIELSGPMLADGCGSADQGTVWFATNDLGAFANDGSLVVLGRLDDVILSGGVNLQPPAIETTVAPILAAELGTPMTVCAVGVPDQKWGHAVAVVAAPLSPASATHQRPPFPYGLLPQDSLARVRAACQPREYAPRYVILVENLPTLPSGKADRQQIARLAATLVGA